MRLSELAPKWVGYPGSEGYRYGISFLCPHCKDKRLIVLFTPPINAGDPDWFMSDEKRKTNKFWNRTGDTFDTLTLLPSIDFGATGHFHGVITNGEVTQC